MKRSKNLGIIVGIVIIVGIIASFGLMQTEFGYSVMSISNAKFLTGATDLNGYDAYLVDVIVNKGGEQLEGTISPEMLAQYGITNMPSGNFKVYLNLKNVTCDYNIKWDDTTIYKIYQATARYSLCGRNCDNGCTSKSSCPYSYVNLDTVKKACKGEWTNAKTTAWGHTHNPEECNKAFCPMGTDNSATSPGSPVAGGDCNALVDIQTTPVNPAAGGEASEWCYAMPNEILEGWDGNHWRATHIAGIPWFVGYTIDTTPTASYQVEVVLENSKGEKVTTILDNKVGTAFLNDIGRVKVVGSLVAQEYCGQPAIDKAIVKDLNTNTMKVVKKEYYSDYKSKLFELVNFDNNYYKVLNTDPGLGADVLWDKMSTLNSLHRNIYATEIKDNCKINGMIYSCTPIKDIVYPELQLIIKASWLGIRIATGEPKIEDIDIPNKIYEGESTFLTVRVKNVGTTADGVDTSLVCNKEISLGSVRETIGAGETESVYINLDGAAGAYNCSVYARSVSDPTKFDKKAISLNILARDVPKPTTCESIPAQPCGRALWQAYPICSWNTQFCEEEPKTNWLLIGLIIAGVLVAFVIVYFLIKSPKRRR